jgi:hypothetical protein
VIPDDPSNPNLNRHLRMLGVCWALYGILRLLTAVWLAFFSSTAILMFGALLSRVPDPFTLMNCFHFFYGLLVAVSAACGILGVLAGLALLSGAQSGRMLAIIAAFLSVSSIPLGTTLGIYTLIVLLAWNARRKSATVPGTPISNLKRQPFST